MKTKIACMVLLLIFGGVVVSAETGTENIENAGSVLIGIDNSIPYFPQGLILGNSPSSAEHIGYKEGIIYFSSENGADFQGNISAERIYIGDPSQGNYIYTDETGNLVFHTDKSIIHESGNVSRLMD